VMTHYEHCRQLIVNKYLTPVFRKGDPVRAWGKQGVITGIRGTNILVRFEGEKQTTAVYPLEIAFPGDTDAHVKLRQKRVNDRIDKFNAQLNNR
jgi:hypothetical protein